MKMTMPARTGAAPITVDSPRLTLIGANGAGKTRFAAALADSLKAPIYRMSALKAIFERDSDDDTPGSVDSLYREAVGRSPMIRPDIRGGFERLMALLVNETAIALLAERLDVARPHAPAITRLQTLIDCWEQIFPGNRILLTAGRLLVGNASGESYSMARLSNGEKAVLYHLGAALMAPRGAAVFVDAPEMFLHPSSIRPLWERIEVMRPDCTFIYITHDLSFASGHRPGDIIWVKGCDTESGSWTYDRLTAADGLPENVYLAILGERKPVLFIEGDSTHSYDARLYPLVFPEYTVKPLGSCDRVIEATRSFNALRAFHSLDAYGIVDRDRRDTHEVEYLRTRRVLVSEVAEIENLFMMEDVVKAVARVNGRDSSKAFARVRANMLRLFRANITRQALEHTRHRLKREVQCRIDGRFDGIGALEQHVGELMHTLNPRGSYDALVDRFTRYCDSGNYAAVLRVFNFKSMITETRVGALTGVGRDDRRSYIEQVLAILRRPGDGAAADIRAAIRSAFSF